MRSFSPASKKKWLIPVAVGAVALGVGGATLLSTIARYSSTGTATGTAQIAKWAIQASTDGTTFTSITGTTGAIPGTFALSTQGNAYVAGGKIAPGTIITSAPLYLKAEDTDVAVEYTFSVGSNASASAFTITGLELVDITDTHVTYKPDNIQTTGNEIRVIVPLDKVGEVIAVTVKAEWKGLCDAADTTCVQADLDAADTALGINAASTTFPVNVIARQYLGN
jgi:hypothetical protein